MQPSDEQFLRLVYTEDLQSGLFAHCPHNFQSKLQRHPHDNHFPSALFNFAIINRAVSSTATILKTLKLCRGQRLKARVFSHSCTTPS